jgi:hypothetical protein
MGAMAHQASPGMEGAFQTHQRKSVSGVITLKYEAVAKKNGSCAEYEITDTMPFPPNYVQLKVPEMLANP